MFQLEGLSSIVTDLFSYKSLSQRSRSKGPPALRRAVCLGPRADWLVSVGPVCDRSFRIFPKTA